MSFQACHADMQCLPYGVVAAGIEAIERCRRMTGNVYCHVGYTPGCRFCIADFHDQHIVSIGGVVLGCRETAKAFVASLGRGGWVGTQVADQDAREKRLAVSRDINDCVLNFSWLFMHFTGDFHD